LRPLDVFLATMVCSLWGIAYLVTPFALTTLTSYEVVALRFAIPALLVVFVGKPPVSWPMLITLGTCLFLAPYLLYTLGLEEGVPGGIASILGQAHIVFVAAVAWVLLKEKPTKRSIASAALGFLGIATIVAPTSAGVSTYGAVLLVLSTLVWSIGNVLMRRVPPTATLTLVPWMCVVPAVPMLAYCAWTTGIGGLTSKVLNSGFQAWGPILYLAVVSTTAAYAVWGRLLSRNPASTLTPFLLIAPCIAVVLAAVLTGERFSPLRLFGVFLVLAGLAVATLPARKPRPA
jgi:O-acetylserine/cysteine efflux transporter